MKPRSGSANAHMLGAVIGPAAASRRHLVFDLDGTLIDSNAVCVAILQSMLAERGSTRLIDSLAARPLMSRGGLRMVEGLLADECGDAAIELGEFRTRYLVKTTSVDTLYGGVLPGLRRLATEGFTMAICSNKPQALCEKVLVDTGLDALFTVVVGGQPERAPKPAPDALHAVLELLDQERSACIFIGDSELDYRVARDADLPFAFMTYGYAEGDWHPEAANDWHSDASESFDHFDRLVEALLTAI